AFAAQAFTITGLKVAVLSAIIVIISGLFLVFGGRFAGLSSQRTAGALAGFVGQPAVFAYGTSRSPDERLESGYSALFALGIIAKIILVTLIVTL
ncbi:MAG TPA: transporter, partial [Actinomycetales bacterium]|nr:transporter [Actinomycetales bacterium]